MMNSIAKKRQMTLQPQELSLFASQLALLVEAGIPFEEGLQSIGKSMSKDGQDLVEQMRDVYMQRYSLKSALEETQVFPEYMISMVGIGEESGNLDAVLKSLAMYYQHQADMMQQIRQAVTYPVVSILTMAVVVAVLVWKVIPIFVDVMNSLGGVVGTFSQFGPLLGYVVLGVLVVLLAVILAAALALKTGRAGEIVKMLSIFPTVRSCKEKFFAARFANVMSMLLYGGYQTQQALEFLLTILPEDEWKARIARIQSRMEGGEKFSTAVNEEHVFPGLYAGLLSVGDQTGSVDAVMNQLAQIYQDQALEDMDHLVARIQPVLVGVLSVAVGAILLSVMMPLLGIMSVIG